jgi:hypothetical protein
MATGKAAKKEVKAVAAGRKAAPAKTGVKPSERTSKVAAALPLPEKPPMMPKRPAGPTARTCPLVLDGELDASDFSPSDCLTCSEFDCRFCEAEEGSGSLRSRLFAGSSEGEEAEDAWGGDSDFEGGEERGGGEEGEEEDLF